MNLEEALEWLAGNRSMGNLIPVGDFSTWQVRIAQADAAMVQQAYYIVRAHHEEIIAKEALFDTLPCGCRTTKGNRCPVHGQP